MYVSFSKKVLLPIAIFALLISVVLICANDKSNGVIKGVSGVIVELGSTAIYKDVDADGTNDVSPPANFTFAVSSDNKTLTIDVAAGDYAGLTVYGGETDNTVVLNINGNVTFTGDFSNQSTQYSSATDQSYPGVVGICISPDKPTVGQGMNLIINNWSNTFTVKGASNLPSGLPNELECVSGFHSTGNLVVNGNGEVMSAYGSSSTGNKAAGAGIIVNKFELNNGNPTVKAYGGNGTPNSAGGDGIAAKEINISSGKLFGTSGNGNTGGWGVFNYYYPNWNTIQDYIKGTGITVSNNGKIEGIGGNGATRGGEGVTGPDNIIVRNGGTLKGIGGNGGRFGGNGISAAVDANGVGRPNSQWTTKGIFSDQGGLIEGYGGTATSDDISTNCVGGYGIQTVLLNVNGGSGVKGVGGNIVGQSASGDGGVGIYVVGNSSVSGLDAGSGSSFTGVGGDAGNINDGNKHGGAGINSEGDIVVDGGSKVEGTGGNGYTDADGGDGVKSGGDIDVSSGGQVIGEGGDSYTKDGGIGVDTEGKIDADNGGVKGEGGDSNSAQSGNGINAGDGVSGGSDPVISAENGASVIGIGGNGGNNGGNGGDGILIGGGAGNGGIDNGKDSTVEGNGGDGGEGSGSTDGGDGGDGINTGGGDINTGEGGSTEGNGGNGGDGSATDSGSGGGDGGNGIDTENPGIGGGGGDVNTGEGGSSTDGNGGDGGDGNLPGGPGGDGGNGGDGIITGGGDNNVDPGNGGNNGAGGNGGDSNGGNGNGGDGGNGIDTTDPGTGPGGEGDLNVDSGNNITDPGNGGKGDGSGSNGDRGVSISTGDIIFGAGSFDTGKGDTVAGGDVNVSGGSIGPDYPKKPGGDELNPITDIEDSNNLNLINLHFKTNGKNAKKGSLITIKLIKNGKIYTYKTKHIYLDRNGVAHFWLPKGVKIYDAYIGNKHYKGNYTTNDDHIQDYEFGYTSPTGSGGAGGSNGSNGSGVFDTGNKDRDVEIIVMIFAMILLGLSLTLLLRKEKKQERNLKNNRR